MTLKPVLVGLIVVGLAFGTYAYVNRPRDVPPLQLLDKEGNRVTLDSLRGSKEYLLMVFINPRCGMSKYSLTIINQQLQKHAGRVEFVGLAFTDQAGAERQRETLGVRFPVFGIHNTPDPIAVNELIELIGFSRGSGFAVWGGTVFAVNADGKLLFSLEKEGVQDLPERLDELVI